MLPATQHEQAHAASAEQTQHTLAGMARLAEMLAGADHEEIARIGSLTISAGNIQCTGSLAEALGRHDSVASGAVDVLGMGVRNAVEQADRTGAARDTTVETALGMFLVRDKETNAPVRTNLDQILKKN